MTSKLSNNRKENGNDACTNAVEEYPLKRSTSLLVGTVSGRCPTP